MLNILKDRVEVVRIRDILREEFWEVRKEPVIGGRWERRGREWLDIVEYIFRNLSECGGGRFLKLRFFS